MEIDTDTVGILVGNDDCDVATALAAAADYPPRQTGKRSPAVMCGVLFGILVVAILWLLK